MAGDTASERRNDVAIVAIGRNEGGRLQACLESIAGQARAVYVDSGSVDDSLAIAEAVGVEAIGLPRDGPHSAARGRNAGLAWCDDPGIRYVQMIDSDCRLDRGWLPLAAAALDSDPGIVAVVGRLREVAPERSIYNRLCDIEWRPEQGSAPVFGGIVLLRRDAAIAAGGYDETMIAGEDIDLALRMRAGGGRILSLPDDMARHDAAITRFATWWRRTARGGYAFASLAARHRGPKGAPYRKAVARMIWWGGLVPCLIVAGAVAGVAAPSTAWIAASALALVLVQMLRMFLRGMRLHPIGTAAAQAIFLTIGKYAEMTGLLRYWCQRPMGRAPRLNDYKDRAAT